MNASQLSLPGMQARIENGQLTVQTEAEDRYCGRAVAIARAWQLWMVQSGNQLDKKDSQHSARSDLFEA
jgi:hypothetical protein